MSDNKLTVIVMVYNEEYYLESMFSNILQNYDYIDEILVSDNCSTDNSAIICEQYAQKYSKIHFVKTNLHIASMEHAFRCIIRVQSEWVMFWRPKNWLSERYVKSCLDTLKAYPDMIVAFANVYTHFIESRHQPYKINAPLKAVPAESLELLASDDEKIRIETAIENAATPHLFYQLCKTEALRYSIAHTECEESASDWLIGLRMAIYGKWAPVKEADYHYFYRRESCEEVNKRLRDNGFYIRAVNPYWYLPVMSWEICKIKAPRVCNPEFMQKIILRWRYSHGAEIDDREWLFRRTKGAMIDTIAKIADGRKIALFGAGKDGKEIYNIIQSRLEIDCFLDNDTEKQKRLFMGKKVFSPNELKFQHGYVICICSREYAYEMLKQMLELGYVYFDNLFGIAKEVPMEYI